MATGITAEAGSGRMNSSVGSSKSRAKREEPMAAPSDHADDRGEQPAEQHAQAGADKRDPERAVGDTIFQHGKRARRRRKKDRRNEMHIGEQLPDPDEGEREGERRQLDEREMLHRADPHSAIAPAPTLRRIGVEQVAENAEPDELGIHQADLELLRARMR